ncbi:MAG TPA: RNA polymerase sigma factor [Thermoanaerobaculia bacterium]|nr:RNA polymerase sigma factor [Thermoanaerobaculia bacterium]
MTDAAEVERFRRLFEVEQGRVYRFVYAMVGAAEAAKELTQETFVRAFRGFGGYEGRGAASTWLCGIARNVVLNHFRSQRHFARVFDVDAEPERAGGATPELRASIRAALLRLDADKRAAFTLKVMEGMSYEEIAAVTGAAVAKLKTDVHRARLQLRAELAGMGEER